MKVSMKKQPEDGRKRTCDEWQVLPGKDGKKGGGSDQLLPRASSKCGSETAMEGIGIFVQKREVFLSATISLAS